MHEGEIMFQRRFWWFVFVGVFASVLAATISGCGGNSPAMSVSVTAAASTVDGNDTTTLTATVSNDKNAAGVTWTMSGPGTMSGETTSSASYKAPAATSSSQTVTITATSVADTTKTGTATITVAAAPAITSLTTAQQSVAVGTAYSVQLAGTGGISPYKNWALASGSLPPCLSLSSAGVLSSTQIPTAACIGVYSGIKFSMTDSGTPDALTATSSAQTITVMGPTITFAPTLPQGAVGTAYVGSVAATGPVGAATYSIASGTLPADLSLNTSTGAITGTPKAADAGTATFTVSVVDAFGDAATSGSMSISIAAAPAITFGAAPAATATFNVAYTSAVTATGGAGTLEYTLASGALPPDLALSAGGAISGTPKAADIGTFTFAVKATDAFGDSATSGNYSIVVSYPALNVTQSTPPIGYVGSAYPSTSLSATGGNGGSYTWTWTAAGGSSIPPGLNLSTAGAITGTPTTAGTYSVVVTATDSASNTGNATLMFTIKAGITINSITLPTGYAGSAYPPTGAAATLSAAGGAGAPYTWNMAAASGSTVPPGLNIGASSGVISGTPTTQGSYSVVITASDSATPANTASVTLPITIGAGVAVTPPTLTPAYNGTLYTSSAFAATGGNGGPYTWSWAAAAGSTLPSGLNIDTNTAVISGTPANNGTTTATSDVVVTATDSLGNKGSANAAISVEATVTITTATLPPATVGANYDQALAAAGGSGTYQTWQVTSGASSLAAVGLSLNTGTGHIAGTSPTAGTASFSVTVTDSQGHVSVPVAYTVPVNTLLKINQTSLPPGNAGSNYSQALTASGGSGTYSNWSVISGASSLAGVGLSLNTSTGAITGSSPTAGTANFTVQVTDSASATAQQAFTIQIYSALSLPASNPSTLGPATINILYGGTIVATGGSGNYSWTVTGLPSDSLNYSTNGATLTISGTPGTATTVPFTAKVTDTTTNITVGPYNYSVTVYSGVTLPSPNPATLGQADASSAYSGTIVAAGGSGNYSWTVTGMPADGLNYSTSGATLTISGTPTSAQTVQFTAKVTDTTSNQTAGPFTYSIVVNGPLSLPTPDPSSLPANGYTGAQYTGYINASGGSGSYSWTVSGLPQDGLSVTGGTNGSTLTIGGTPTSAQTVTFNATVTDTATGNSITQNGYNITISNPTPVSLQSGSLTPATVNQDYNGAINVSGGVPPYTWSINGTTVGSSCYSLGNGNMCATSNGGTYLSVYGTPTSTGTVTLTNVKVTDSVNSSDTKSYALTVNPQSTLQVSVDLSGLPQGMVNMPYTFDGGVNINGGTGPYTITYQNLPAGLSEVTQHNYDVEGTPTSSGTTTVTVNVSDSSSPVQHASTTFDLTVVPQTTGTNNSRLSGQYACYLMEYWQGGATGGSGHLLWRGGLVFAFTADGSGHITGGELDQNSPVSGYHSAASIGAIGGTYAVGADNRGYLLPSAGGGSMILALAGGNLDSNSRFSDFAVIKMDDVGTSPSGQYGGGHCYKQNTTGLSGAQPSGGYAFGMRGEDSQGNLESQAGSGQWSGGAMSGVIDMVDAGTYQGPMSISGTTTATADAYGRMTQSIGPAGQPTEANPSVMYMTNNAAGETLIMSTNSHNAANNADFLIGEARAQNAAHVAAAHPFSGPFVLYMAGLDSDQSTYNAEVVQGTGSSTATSIAINTDISNNGGTIDSRCPGGGACPATMTYTTDPSTGRTTLGGQSGIAFYVYDTNSAVLLFGDAGGGSSNPENRLGWLEPQTAPSSGTWASSNLATSLFMTKFIDGNTATDLNTSTLTIGSSGSILSYAEDDNGDGFADWDEGLCGSGCSGTVTAAIVPDTTANATTGTLGLDPTGALGVFDVQGTQGSTTQVISYCIAISVDQATNSSTKGRFVCLDTSSHNGTLSIGQE
jgi:hypothetical protein